MSNQAQAHDLIRNLLGQANILAVPRIFIDYMGNIEGAVLLSQCLYWSDKTQDPDGWFFKTYKDWEKEICLSKYQVMKHADKMKELGFLETTVRRARGSPTVHYKILFDKFLQSIVQFLDERTSNNLTNLDSQEIEQSLTETTIDYPIEPRRDFLADLAGFEPGEEGVAVPDDFQRHFGYRDEILQIYNEETGIVPNQGRKTALIELAQIPKFCPSVFRQILQGYNRGGGNPYDIEAISKAYHNKANDDHPEWEPVYNADGEIVGRI